MKCDLYSKKTFVLNGIIYLPHYNERNKYVSPGYGLHNYDLYTEKELLSKNAKPEAMMLWLRSW